MSLSVLGGSGLSVRLLFVCLFTTFLPVPPRCWVISWDLAGPLSTCRHGLTWTERVTCCRALE